MKGENNGLGIGLGFFFNTEKQRKNRIDLMPINFCFENNF